MTNHVQIFTNDQIGEIKGFIKDGEPWFLAGDVCRTLGIKNARDAVRDIEQKYKSAGVKGVGSSYALVDTKGGRQKAVIIPEPFLYELIFNSRKQKAVIFRAWVTNEVLPALRKHGHYRMEGKLIRRSETDAIRDYVEYAKASGSDNAEMYYVTITKVTNKILGVTAGQRDSMTPDQLKQLAIIEGVVELALREGMRNGLSYKDIYKLARDRAKASGVSLGLAA